MSQKKNNKKDIDKKEKYIQIEKDGQTKKQIDTHAIGRKVALSQHWPIIYFPMIYYFYSDKIPQDKTHTKNMVCRHLRILLHTTMF